MWLVLPLVILTFVLLAASRCYGGVVGLHRTSAGPCPHDVECTDTMLYLFFVSRIDVCVVCRVHCCLRLSWCSRLRACQEHRGNACPTPQPLYCARAGAVVSDPSNLTLQRQVLAYKTYVALFRELGRCQWPFPMYSDVECHGVGPFATSWTLHTEQPVHPRDALSTKTTGS